MGYWPGCYSPQECLGVLACLHKAPGWPGGNVLAVTGPRLLQHIRGSGLAATDHRGYWSGCYRPQVGLGVLARLLQAPGWPRGTGLAAVAHRGYWPGCYSPRDRLGILARLLQAPCWSVDAGLAA